MDHVADHGVNSTAVTGDKEVVCSHIPLLGPRNQLEIIVRTLRGNVLNVRTCWFPLGFGRIWRGIIHYGGKTRQSPAPDASGDTINMPEISPSCNPAHADCRIFLADDTKDLLVSRQAGIVKKDRKPLKKCATAGTDARDGLWGNGGNCYLRRLNGQCEAP